MANKQLTKVISTASWDKHAPLYEQVIERSTWLWGRDAITLAGLSTSDEVKSPLRYLEVACGPGQLALTASDMGFDVTATDFSPGMVERLQSKVDRRGITNIKAQVADGQTLEGFSDNSYDIVASNFGMFMFPDRNAGWRSALRVLQPGGRLLCTSWDKTSSNLKTIQYILANAINNEGQSPVDMSFMHSSAVNRTLEQTSFKEELVENGFENVTVHSVNHAMCFKSGREYVEMILDNGAIGPMLAHKNKESVKLTILEFCRLNTKGLDPFNPPATEDTTSPFVPRSDNRPEDHSLWNLPFAVQCLGLIAIASKPVA